MEEKKEIDIIGWSTLPIETDNYIIINPTEIKNLTGIDILKYTINTNKCSFLDLVFFINNKTMVAMVPKQLEIIWKYSDESILEKIINYIKNKAKIND